MKKFVVSIFLDYKMIDSKGVINQVQELQVILHETHAEGMSLSESFHVEAIIEKLPPLRKNFKNYIKHKRKEMKLEGLIVRLRLEEDNHAFEKKARKTFTEAKLKEQSNTSKKPVQANVTELDTLSIDVSDINLSAVVSEVNLVGSTREWWLDTGAT
ncbi:hypothetical protein AAC387_Pa11g0957 [Persea americana]